MRRPPLVAASALIVAALLVGMSGRQSLEYDVQPASGFWIDGTSTVSSFTCQAAGIAGQGRVAADRVAGELAIPVHSFDCGLGAMNRDFFRALRGSEHPEIRFTIQRAEMIEEATRPGEWSLVRAHGSLELAGARRALTLLAEGRTLDDGTIRVRGQHQLRMTHFGVEPPTGMLGLVRAHDQVTARFDLVAAASRRSASR